MFQLRIPTNTTTDLGLAIAEGPYCKFPSEENPSPSTKTPVIAKKGETPHYDMPSIAEQMEQLSDQCEEQYFNYHDKLLIPYYMSRAENEVAVIAMTSGLKPDHPISRKYLRACNKRGISVIWMNLPNSVRDPISMPEYSDMILFFFTDPRSPLYKHFNPEKIAFFLQTHSSSGPLTTDLVLSEEHKGKFKHFKAGIMESSFWDNINGKGLKYALSLGTFNVVAWKNWPKLSYESIEGLLYLHNCAIKKELKNYNPFPNGTMLEKITRDIAINLHVASMAVKCRINLPKHNTYIADSFLSERGSPTYSQMYLASTHNRKIAKKIRKAAHNSKAPQGATQPSIPLIFIAGADDNFSAGDAIEKVAGYLKQKFIKVAGGHKPLSENKAARKALFNEMKALVPEIAKRPKTSSTSELPEIAEPMNLKTSFLTRAYEMAQTITNATFGRVVKPYAATDAPPDKAPQAF